MGGSSEGAGVGSGVRGAIVGGGTDGGCIVGGGTDGGCIVGGGTDGGGTDGGGIDGGDIDGGWTGGGARGLYSSSSSLSFSSDIIIFSYCLIIKITIVCNFNSGFSLKILV